MILLLLLLLALSPAQADTPLRTALAACHRAADEALEHPQTCHDDLVAAAQALHDVPGAETVRHYLLRTADAGAAERIELSRRAVGLVESLGDASYPPGFDAATRDRQRNRLHEVLQRPEFNQRDSDWIVAVRELMRRVVVWLEHLSGQSYALALVAHVMMFGVAAGALLFAAWSLAQVVLRRFVPEPSTAAPVADVTVRRAADADALLLQAAERARAEDWRMAVRHAFSALLVRLHGQAGLAFDPALTRREVRASLPPDLAVRAEAGADVFEPCWYGGHPAGPDDYEAVLALCARESA